MRAKDIRNESLKEISGYLNIDKDTARTVKNIVKAYHSHQIGDLLKDNELFPNTRAWVKQCYNPPLPKELALNMIDEIIGTYGIEGFEIKDNTRVEYCNAGDTYNGTVCRHDGYWMHEVKFFLSTYGDIVEKYGKDED